MQEQDARNGGPVAELSRLWRGKLPLRRAFWLYAVAGGVSINLATSILFLVMVAADRPALGLIVGYIPSVPYNILALVGVWRAADKYQGNRVYADLARIVALVGLIVLSVI